MSDSADPKPAAYVLPEEYVASPDRFFMEWLPAAVAAYPEVGRRYGNTHATAQIELDGDAGGVWHVVLGDNALHVHRGPHEAPSFALHMATTLWRRLQKGEVNGVKAFLKGEIKLRGSWIMFLRIARKFG